MTRRKKVVHPRPSATPEPAPPSPPPPQAVPAPLTLEQLLAARPTATIPTRLIFDIGSVLVPLALARVNGIKGELQGIVDRIERELIGDQQ